MAHASGSPHKSRLERVVQTELNMSFLGANAANCTEVAVGDSVIRISVTGDVEEIEEVSPEAKDMLLTPQVEVLKERRVDAAVTRRPFGAVMGRAERILSRHPISTGSVRWTRSGVVRGLVDSPPVCKRAMVDDHGMVLIGSTEAPSAVVGVAVVWAKDSDGQS